MPSYPRISIVTPSFNQGPYLEKTIQSVLSQGYPNLDYVVIDGGSTDQSVGIIRKYESQLSYWVSEKDRGQSHAINKGFERADGDILGWLNSDDWLAPNALAAIAQAAEAYPQAGAFVGHGAKVDLSGNVVYYKKPRALTFIDMCQWMDGGNFMQPSCFFRREAWLAAGPLDEDVHIALDVDLWLKMAKKIQFQALDQLLSYALVHDGAKTTAFRNLMVVDCALIVARAGGDVHVRARLEDLANELTRYQNSRVAKMQRRIDRVVRAVKNVLKGGRRGAPAGGTPESPLTKE